MLSTINQRRRLQSSPFFEDAGAREGTGAGCEAARVQSFSCATAHLAPVLPAHPRRSLVVREKRDCFAVYQRRSTRDVLLQWNSVKLGKSARYLLCLYNWQEAVFCWDISWSNFTRIPSGNLLFFELTSIVCKLASASPAVDLSPSFSASHVTINVSFLMTSSKATRHLGLVACRRQVGYCTTSDAVSAGVGLTYTGR